MAIIAGAAALLVSLSLTVIGVDDRMIGGGDQGRGLSP